MKKLSYPIKFLLLVTVFSLLPVAVGVSPLDYKGSSLEAADEEKKKKKRRRTKLPSKKMQRILQNLVPEAMMQILELDNLQELNSSKFRYVQQLKEYSRNKKTPINGMYLNDDLPQATKKKLKTAKLIYNQLMANPG